MPSPPNCLDSMKPLLLYSNPAAFNPLKTSLLITLLSLPHTTTNFTFLPRSNPSDPYLNALAGSSSSKSDANPDFTSNLTEADPLLRFNPDKKVPFIHDPNTNVSLAESNAIARYLLSTYDKDGMWWYLEGKERWEIEMWLDFQVSQQGMVFQKAYILAFNETHLDYLKTMQAQMRRTIKALDDYLSSSDPKTNQRREWLVSTKCTIADLCFVVWDMPQVLDMCFKGEEDVDNVNKREERWPAWAKWHERVQNVDGVRKFLENAEALKKP